MSDETISIATGGILVRFPKEDFFSKIVEITDTGLNPSYRDRGVKAKRLFVAICDHYERQLVKIADNVANAADMQTILSELVQIKLLITRQKEK